jgi:cytochrome P450
MASAPPGPRLSAIDRLLYRPGRNPLEFFVNIQKEFGDIAMYQMAGERIYLVSDPQHIKDILVTHNRNFVKSRGLERARRLLGDGLLTSEDPLHLRQRRLMQPAFHRERIAEYGRTMAAYADRMRAGWTDGAVFDVAQDMSRLTLSIAGKTLFDLDVERQAGDVGRALNDVMESFWTTMLPMVDLLEWMPIPQLRRARTARARLDSIVYTMIAERRAEGVAMRDRGDLLSMLLLAHDDEASGAGDERTMSDRQVRDEALTIFLAGHETTANALTWTWYLLSENPDIEARLHAEVDRVLQGRLPSLADIPALPLVERVVTEAMRLYPPAWIIGRRALAPYALGPFTVPARSIVVMSPYIVQRDARHYPQPDRFDPDRWTPEFKARLPKFAYFPFGGGPRGCIGESFAWMELMLVVAAVAQRWSLKLVPGHPVVPQPVITLRTKHGMKMTAHSR